MRREQINRRTAEIAGYLWLPGLVDPKLTYIRGTERGLWNPCVLWEQAFPLIEQYGVRLEPVYRHGVATGWEASCMNGGSSAAILNRPADDPLEAAMLAIIAHVDGLN